jgi:diaminopimelate decarboxylase
LHYNTFHYHHGALHCDEVPLAAIADAASTPVYVYSLRRLHENIQRLQTAFPNATLHYSLKANASLAIIRQLYQTGIGMDAVSGGEIFRAISAGVNPADIVFAGVGKTAHEIDYALQVGIGWFNVESEAELQLLNRRAAATGKTPVVALRLNPGIQAQTHHYIATGHGGAKFGLDSETIARLLANQHHYSHLKIRGLHVHIGSQLGHVAETVEAVQHAQTLAKPCPELRTLNIGGGFPVSYTGDEHYPSPEDFAAALHPLSVGWQLKLEPGRFIVADAGALLISVLYTKTRAGKTFAITDGSMTELIRPALYQAVHPIIPFHQKDAPLQPTTVAGPVCESADILREDMPLPPLSPGDRLAVLVAGAYGFVMASNYNQRLRPPEVLVDGANWQIIRRRETWHDLIRLEQ